MFATTFRRPLVAAAALFFALTAATAAQQPSATATAPQDDSTAVADAVAEEDDAAPVAAEPDFRVLNLPSTLRLPRHASNFQLTHRFNGNLRRGTLGGNAGNLFGLDQGAAVGFEYRFGIARGIQAAVYRTAIDKAFQFHGKWDAVRQHGARPVSLSALVSIEGTDNFQERYSPALGVVVSRLAGDRLAVYATPMWVHNTAALLDVDRDTVFVGIGGRARISARVYVVAEVAPRLGGYRPDTAAYGFGLETRAGGHLFQLNFNNGQGTTFGQLARGGSPNSLYLGFNLARKFF
jgi:hypothetical protein